MIRFCRHRTLSWEVLAATHRNKCKWVSSSKHASSSHSLATQQEENHTVQPISEFNSLTYSHLLKICTQTGEPTTGKGLHCDILKRGSTLDLFAWNVLLNMYVKSGLLSDARNLFDEMPKRNVVSFVTLIQGCFEELRGVEAFDLFVRLHREGHELNPFAFTAILKLLVGVEWGELSWNIHAPICKLGHDSNAFVGTALVDAYSVCGFVDMARKVFDGITDKDMVSWSGMVACYAENVCFEEAIKSFSEMRVMGFMQNQFTLASVLKACLGLQAIEVGKSVHGCALKACYEIDPYVSVGLLDLYTKCGDIGDAKQVFEEIPTKDVITWSFMIARYSQSDRCKEAVELFCLMRQAFLVPNQFTLASALQACATMESLDLGKQIHCHVLKAGLDLNIYVSNAVMDVYAKCGKMESSVDLFLESTYRNDATWNTIIVGYVHLGDGEKALSLFSKMLEDRVQATEVTYSCVFRACASLAALEPGIQIHSLTIKTAYNEDVVVCNSLIDMYAKCGSIKDARFVFDTMNNRDVVSWNSMVCSYSMHGLADDALMIFKWMQEADIWPNQLTFVGVLSACSNTGSLNQGQAYFASMKRDYGIEPCMEHYTCMVSLLGRLGHLDKAIKLIEEIPVEPSVMVWRALLGACVMHNDVELGIVSAQHVLEMEPQDEGTYVLLSNIYATMRSWDNVASVRKKMKKKRVKKEAGLSWIENQGTVHYFSVANDSHPDTRLIYGMLEWLNMRIKKAGYVPDCKAILLNVEDDEKPRLLWVHSERLALAFGLIRAPHASPIRIMKNLRICVDCHAAIKFISKLVEREIIVRDINRFHHFQHGLCSCGDYW